LFASFFIIAIMSPKMFSTWCILVLGAGTLAGSVQAQSGWSNNSSGADNGWADNNGDASDGGDVQGDAAEGGQQESGNAGAGGGELDCTFQGDPVSIIDGISFQHILNQVDNTLTVEVTYLGTGWVAFGVSADGQMPGSEVIIAKTDEAQGSSNPGKYSITARQQDAIQLSSQQTLVDASFEQADGTTVLRFTKALAESGELEISADGTNTFVYAVGSSDTFGYHAKRGSFQVNSLTKCVEAGQTAAPVPEGGGVVTGDTNNAPVPSQSLWVAHGIMMFISWGILLPIGIGASVIRRLVPGNGMWFQLHRVANGLAFLLMTAAFGIAVYNVKVDHFSTKNKHKTIGLVIYIFSFLQVLSGIFRPHLPHAQPPKQVEPDVEAEEEVKPAVEETPKKSTRRVVFEVAHRTFGFGLLGLSWYNLYLGVALMAAFYGPSYDLSDAMWGVIGGISGLILVLFVYTKAVPEKK
jgi:DOMON domain